MKIKFRRVLIVFLGFLISHLNSYCQQNQSLLSNLSNKINDYGANKSSILFAHFDKTIYLANEQVWFTAYLLNYNEKFNNPTILTALLVNDDTKATWQEQRFTMTNGLSFGSISIPNNISPGNYTFILYTNQLTDGKILDHFVQQITIKTSVEPVIKTRFTIVDSSHEIGHSSKKVLLNVFDKFDKPIKADIKYQFGGITQSIISKSNTNETGDYLLTIPVLKKFPNNNKLYVTINTKNEVEHATFTLPLTDEECFDVKFYPEGGNLVDGLECRIGWEVKNKLGAPLKIKGLLYKNKDLIDTVSTDVYGLGNFKVLPQNNTIYKVKLIGTQHDTSYILPPSLKYGLALKIEKAIVNDSLKFSINSTDVGKYFVIIHNFQSLYYSFPVNLIRRNQTILVNLADVPKGINTITVVDSLKRPLAERLFFAHYGQKVLTEIKIDSAIYFTRKKVTVKINIKNNYKDSFNGIVSIACVQSARLQHAKINNIEDYVYFQNPLDFALLNNEYSNRKMNNNQILEELLLIKGWRRYKWQDVVDYKNLVLKTSLISFFGNVSHNGRPLKKPETLMIKTDSSTHVFNTLPNGSFGLDDNFLLVNPEKKVHLLLKNSSSNIIEIGNVFKKYNDSLTNNFTTPVINTNSIPLSEENDIYLPGNEKSVLLKTVVIKSTKINDYGHFDYNRDILKANACGDYVCRFNILNCPNHKGEADNRPAVIGEIYNNGALYYKGCTNTIIDKNSSIVDIDGINNLKEFYGPDYSRINLSEPDYQSTLYWKYLSNLSSKKELSLSFYTTDITGPFKIVVQGITKNDVIYAEKEFSVKKQP